MNELELEDLAGWTPEQWDAALAGYSSTRFYHGSAWLGMLEANGRGRVVRCRIREGGLTRGYFAALLVRKGPFRILGSPLSGTMSEYQGPVGDPDFPMDGWLGALDRFCRARRIHQLELGGPLLDPALLQRAGYEIMEWKTIEVGLADSSESMWKAISSKARNRIRRAEGFRLVAQDSADPEFVARHYQLVGDLFGRQHIPPPYSREDYQTLCRHLKPAGQVYTIEIRHPERTNPVASGIFPHDGDTVYSLSTASSEEGRGWCANDLLHWSVMRLAGQSGLARYRMGDNYRSPETGGRFKDKFGGEQQPVFRFLRHYSQLARHSRRLYVGWQRLKRKRRG